MTVDGNTFYIAANGDFGALWVWSEVIGMGTWHGEAMGGPDLGYFAAITANGNIVDIIAVGNHGCALDLYWAAKGSSTWHKQTVAGPGTMGRGASIAVNHGAVTIAAAGAQSQLLFYWAANGSSTWHPETVASSVNNSIALDHVQRQFRQHQHHSRGSDLKFYWAADGTSTWHAEGVPGNGTAPPA